MLSVNLPTGGTQTMTHLGDGRFGSPLPPVLFHGIAMGATEPVVERGLPVEWSADVLDFQAQVSAQIWSFDGDAALTQVEAAAAGGSDRARNVLSSLARAQLVLDAGGLEPLPAAAPSAQAPAEGA